MRTATTPVNRTRERIGPLTTLPRDPICREGFRLHRQEFRLCLGGLHSYNKVRMTPLQNFLLKSLLDLLVALAWACWNRLRASQEEHRARALEHRGLYYGSRHGG